MDVDWEDPPREDVDDLPLPAAVHEVLSSLRPPEPRRHSHRGGVGGRPLEDLALLGAVDVVDLALPEFTASAWEVNRDLVAGWAGVGCPDRPLRLFLTPRDIDPREVGRSSLRHLGVTWISWGQPLPLPPPETVRRPSGGDSTEVRVRGTRVLVVFDSRAGTRLVWTAELPGRGRRTVRLETPGSPTEAVERLVRDRGLLP